MARLRPLLSAILFGWVCAQAGSAQSNEGVILSAAINRDRVLALTLTNVSSHPVAILTGIQGSQDWRAMNFMFSLRQPDGHIDRVWCASCSGVIAGLPEAYVVNLAPRESSILTISLENLRASKPLCELPQWQGAVLSATIGGHYRIGIHDKYWTGTATASVPLECGR
jgi:hypothetical protein